jgi:hypothetical protein
VNNNLESTPNTGEPFPIVRNSLTQREQPVVGNVSEDDFTEWDSSSLGEQRVGKQVNAGQHTAEYHGSGRNIAEEDNAGRLDTGSPSKDSPNTEQRTATRTGEGNEWTMVRWSGIPKHFPQQAEMKSYASK